MEKFNPLSRVVIKAVKDNGEILAWSCQLRPHNLSSLKTKAAKMLDTHGIDQTLITLEYVCKETGEVLLTVDPYYW